jgi:MFS family permease
MQARWAVSAIFFVNGVVLASWVAHIPAVKARHGLGDDRLGLVLLSMAVGAVLALPLAAWLIARWGSRRITSIAAVGFCLALPLPILAPTAWLVAAALGLFGALNALLDVSMNAQAIAVEKHYRQPIMSAFHALFSVGGLTGALIASASLAGGLGSGWHVALITAVSVAVLAAAMRRLLPSTGAAAPPGAVFVWPPAALLSLGLLTFCGLLVEGAMGDWSAVYLHDAIGATAPVAAGGFAAFSVTMAAGRFSGSYLADRLGPQRLLRWSGALAASGLAAALILATPSAALVGFALVGLGLANVIPVLFSAAGRVSGVPAGTALAAIATTGYGGFLAGPPLIGFVAGLTGLPAALAIVVTCCAVIAGGAKTLPGRGSLR